MSRRLPTTPKPMGNASDTTRPWYRIWSLSRINLVPMGTRNLLPPRSTTVQLHTTRFHWLHPIESDVCSSSSVCPRFTISVICPDHSPTVRSTHAWFHWACHARRAQQHSPSSTCGQITIRSSSIQSALLRWATGSEKESSTIDEQILTTLYWPLHNRSTTSWQTVSSAAYPQRYTDPRTRQRYSPDLMVASNGQWPITTFLCSSSCVILPNVHFSRYVSAS